MSSAHTDATHAEVDAQQLVLAVPSLLHSILLQLLHDPASLALLSLCACVNRLWRDTTYENADLWQRLCNWQRVFGNNSAAAADSSDPELFEHAEIENGDMYATVPQATVQKLQSFVARSRGTLLHLDINLLICVEVDDVVRILSEHAYEGKLLSLRAGGVEIQSDGSSCRAFRSNLKQTRAALAMSHTLSSMLKNWGDSCEAAARRLARGNPLKGILPDERFAALLETPPAENADAAFAIYQRRMHAKLVSFLRTALSA